MTPDGPTLIMFYAHVAWFETFWRTWEVPVQDGPLWSVSAHLDALNEASFDLPDINAASKYRWFMDHRYPRPKP